MIILTIVIDVCHSKNQNTDSVGDCPIDYGLNQKFNLSLWKFLELIKLIFCFILAAALIITKDRKPSANILDEAENVLKSLHISTGKFYSYGHKDCVPDSDMDWVQTWTIFILLNYFFHVT